MKARQTARRLDLAILEINFCKFQRQKSRRIISFLFLAIQLKKMSSGRAAALEKLRSMKIRGEKNKYEVMNSSVF